MINKKRYIITIEEPCHEAWDKMNSLGRDRFCSSCKKIVHDLTDFSEEALQKWAGEQSQPVCGRLVVNQLTQPIAAKPYSQNGSLRLVASLLAITSVLSANAQKVLSKSFKIEQAPQSSKPVLPLVDSSLFRVKGLISDSVSGKPLAGSTILINNKVMAVTDLTGRYSFVLPREYRKPIVEITAEKMGSHQPVTDIIRSTKLPADLNFILSAYECKSTVIISAGIIAIKPVEDKSLTDPKRKPWYRKILSMPNLQHLQQNP